MEKINNDGIDSLIGKTYAMIGDDVLFYYLANKFKEKYFQKINS
jgi:hypothetical protein